MVALITEQYLHEWGYLPLYQEDGNRIHGLKGTNNLIDLKEELGIRPLQYWPTSSPDFNPIEHIWRLLKQRLAQRGPCLRMSDLRAALQEEWNRLTIDEIRKYIKTIPQRLQEAEERNGWATSF